MTVNLKRNLLILAFSATAFALAVSVWLLSFSTIMIVLIWILDNGPARIKLLASEKRISLYFTGIWMVYLAWMLNTSDTAHGLWELRQKLPLLVFPLVTGLSAPFSRKELKIILSCFIAGVIFSSAAGTIASLNDVISGRADSRELSPFISHIRLALMAVFALVCSGWYYFTAQKKTGWEMIYLAGAAWILIYIFTLLSVTGIIMLLVVTFLTLLISLFKKVNPLAKGFAVILAILIVVVPALYIRHEIGSFYTAGNAYEVPLKLLTLNSNSYRHDTVRKDTENGNKVWIYICEPELVKSWNRRSTIPYDSLDMKGQELRYTLIRYMTSAGLKKDSAGISMLSDRDISNIENGITNVGFTRWPRYKSKIYEIIWQVDYYRNGGNPSGHSVTQRIEFLKTGWHLFRQRPLFGTGTGDMVNEMKAQYDIDNSKLDIDHRFLSHNQYLDFLISFGITGFMIISFCLIYPLVGSVIYKRYLPAIFLVIIFISMLWEDTLQTHTGVSFFAYFYSLFIFGYLEDEKEPEKQ